MADLTTVARPYSRALLDIADTHGGLEVWSKALAVAGAIASDPSVHAWLGRPSLTAEDRAKFMADLCVGIEEAKLLADGAGRNLLGLLAENDRLDALAEISAQFEQLKADRENRVKVTLTTATAVAAAQAEKVSAALRKRLGREVELEVSVDPDLVGGAVIRAQDMVIDGSVRARLTRLADALID